MDEDLARSLILPRKKRRVNVCKIHDWNHTAMGNGHSSTQDPPISIQKSSESPTRRPDESGVHGTSNEESRKASASGSNGSRASHSLRTAESANNASASDNSTDSGASFIAVQKGLTEPDQLITSTQRQSEEESHPLKATRLADWRDGMEWDVERGEYDRVTEAEMRRLLAEEASEDARQPQSFLRSEGHIYHRQLNACIRNILRDQPSLVRAGRRLNAFAEPARTQAWLYMMYITVEVIPEGTPHGQPAFDVWALYRATFDFFDDHEPGLDYREFL
ncbi:hypothetical protein EJ03DRAFT_706 [Teratosphaeria nubilosa]|uniref:Uncharacterized protein n=1 Tax=Teratosphaeria nubilosa TaxID=161662 RepID=A0A6G1LNV8_9PEZI|nr:hypothetical protein EJ03DRAFT_706 [Teratosphaeria nubilosa]